MKYNGVDADGNLKNFTDEDLQEGMVVKLRNEAVGMILVYEHSYALSYFERAAGGYTWASNARIKDTICEQYDIVEVYSKRQPYQFFNKTLEQDTLIWKANTEQEKRIQELESTIAQAHEQIQQLKGALK